MQCRYTETAQRIFKHSNMQYTSLTLDKKLNSLMYKMLFYVNMYGLTNFQNSPVFGPPCIVAKRLGRSSWFPVHTHGNSNQYGPILQIPSGARLPAAKVWAEVPLNWPKICLRTEVQYLGNAAWYWVDVNRWPIWNHPSSMLYLLARSPLTQCELEKSKIALASYGRPFLPKLSSCYCHRRKLI